MRRSIVLVLPLLVLAVASCKKGPTQAAVSPESRKYLPPDPAAYAELDFKAARASALLKPYWDQMFVVLPPACKPLLDSLDRISLAAYGSLDDLLQAFLRRRPEPESEAPAAAQPAEPAAPMPDVAVLLTGPTTADLRACLDEAAKLAGGAVREEQRNGQTVLFATIKGMEQAIVSPDDSTHVMTMGARLDAVLAAVAGGPTIDGSPVVGALGTVPPGTFVIAARFPASVASMMNEALEMFAGGKPIPAPTMMAGSIGVGEALSLAGSLTMGDEASAQSFEGLINSGLAMARTMLAAVGDEPKAAPFKQLLGSVAVSRSGAVLTVRATVPKDLATQAMSR
jgi:hypothetical protein